MTDKNKHQDRLIADTAVHALDVIRTAESEATLQGIEIGGHQILCVLAKLIHPGIEVKFEG